MGDNMAQSTRVDMKGNRKQEEGRYLSQGALIFKRDKEVKIPNLKYTKNQTQSAENAYLNFVNSKKKQKGATSGY
jgi:hypothetical protein